MMIPQVNTCARPKPPTPIGSGSFGHIYKEIDRSTGELFARKVPKNSSSLKSFKREAAILSFLHEEKEEGGNRIVGFYGIIQHDKYISLRLSLAKESLFNRMYKGERPIPFAMFTKAIMQLLEGLRYLDGKGVVHADIKPGNILITDRDDFQLADFGNAFIAESYELELSASVLPREGDTFSTLQYIPPEGVLETGEHSFQADIWATACVIAEIVLGDLMFRVEHVEKDPLHPEIQFRGGLLQWHQESLNESYPEDLIESASLRGKKLCQKEPCESEEEASLQDECFRRSESLIPCFNDRFRAMYLDTYPCQPHYLADVQSFLQRMFILDPEARPVAEDLLDDFLIQRLQGEEYNRNRGLV